MSENSNIEEIAWQWFAEAHPHEAHATWPDRFWSYFYSKHPKISREEMERTLKETDHMNYEEFRKSIGIELNPEYCKLAASRCMVTPGLPLA